MYWDKFSMTKILLIFSVINGSMKPLDGLIILPASELSTKKEGAISPLR